MSDKSHLAPHSALSITFIPPTPRVCSHPIAFLLAYMLGLAQLTVMCPHVSILSVYAKQGGRVTIRYICITVITAQVATNFSDPDKHVRACVGHFCMLSAAAGRQ